jgi:hypothetical protein
MIVLKVRIESQKLIDKAGEIDTTEVIIEIMITKSK